MKSFTSIYKNKTYINSLNFMFYILLIAPYFVYDPILFYPRHVLISLVIFSINLITFLLKIIIKIKINIVPKHDTRINLLKIIYPHLQSYLKIFLKIENSTHHQHSSYTRRNFLLLLYFFR